MKQRETDLEKLKEKILAKVPDKFEDLVLKAINLGKELYDGQERFSGENFIIHGLNTAYNCSQLNLDTNSIIAAILHQSASRTYKNEEKAKETLRKIKKEVGEDVTNLIESVEQISQSTKSDKETDIATLKRYIVAGVGDLRPALIRLCDILDDARTLQHIPKEKQLGSAKKIFNIYGPIAEYFNLSDLKKEMEELAFKTIDPQTFAKIDGWMKDLNINIDLKEAYIGHLELISDILGYQPKIYGRVKGVYSTYKKLEKYINEEKMGGIKEIRDLLAFTIISQNEKDCYNISDALQRLTENDPDEFSDYIFKPKPNGYKALHLCIKIPEISDLWVEVQILTHEMYYINTYGPASHIAYKEALRSYVNPTDKYSWVESMHKAIKEHINQREENISIPIPSTFLEDEIFASTPKGKLIQLRKGYTALDFAYKIHSDIGNSAIKAKIDGKEAKLSTVLENGQTVEIICQKGKSPEPKWLDFAISTMARRKIFESIERKRKIK